VHPLTNTMLSCRSVGQIELEASSQLATHDTDLSSAIVSSAPQLQPQVFYSIVLGPGVFQA
jgi:hypothetical protein